MILTVINVKTTLDGNPDFISCSGNPIISNQLILDVEKMEGIYRIIIRSIYRRRLRDLFMITWEEAIITRITVSIIVMYIGLIITYMFIKSVKYVKRNDEEKTIAVVILTVRIITT